MATYVGPIYEASSSVNYWHNSLRMGEEIDRDLAKQFDNDENLGPYIWGQFLYTFILTIITVALYVILAIFKCCCRKNFLSGKAFDGRGQGLVVRIIFMISGGLVLSFGFVYLGLGTAQLAEKIDFLFDEVGVAITKTNAILNNFVDFSQDLRNVGESGQKFLNDIKESCVNAPVEVTEFCNQEVLSSVEKIVTGFKNTVADVNDLSNTFSDAFSGYPDELIKWSDIIGNALDYSRYFGIPIVVLTAVLVLGAILSWLGKKSKCYDCVQSWVIIPLFILLVTSITVVINSFISLASITVSDACLGGDPGSPEDFVKEIMDYQNVDQNTADLVDYYFVSGCRKYYSPLTSLTDGMTELSVSVTALSDLQDILEQNISDQTLMGLLTDLINAFNQTVTDGNTIERQIQCDQINPVLINLSHKGICGLISPTTSLFVIMMFIWACGLIMLITRAACHFP